MSISVPRQVTLVHCHPGLETKELGTDGLAFLSHRLRAQGIGEERKALGALGAGRQSGCPREGGVGGQSVES